MAGRFAPRPTPHHGARRRGRRAQGRPAAPGRRGADPPLDARRPARPRASPSARCAAAPATPTFRITPDGSVWRASRTPAGPRHPAGRRRRGGVAEARGLGAGRRRGCSTHCPDCSARRDDPAAFVPRHRLVHAAHRRRPGLRLTRTGLVLESLIPSVLEQKVTTDEAYRAWRLLRPQYGEPAPGPHRRRSAMHVMPDAAHLGAHPVLGLAPRGRRRQARLHHPARGPRRPPPGGGRGDGARPAAAPACELIPGIGPWTAAETLQRSNGAPDAVTIGDLHLPGIVGYALAGDRDADDAAMLRAPRPVRGPAPPRGPPHPPRGRTPPRRRRRCAARHRRLAGRRACSAPSRCTAPRSGGRRDRAAGLAHDRRSPGVARRALRRRRRPRGRPPPRPSGPSSCGRSEHLAHDVAAEHRRGHPRGAQPLTGQRDQEVLHARARRDHEHLPLRACRAGRPGRCATPSMTRHGTTRYGAARSTSPRRTRLATDSSRDAVAAQVRDPRVAHRVEQPLAGLRGLQQDEPPRRRVVRGGRGRRPRRPRAVPRPGRPARR